MYKAEWATCARDKAKGGVTREEMRRIDRGGSRSYMRDGRGEGRSNEGRDETDR